MRIEPRPPTPAEPASSGPKPAAAAMAMKRLLEAQRRSVEELANDAQSKGRILDIRV